MIRAPHLRHVRLLQRSAVKRLLVLCVGLLALAGGAPAQRAPAGAAQWPCGLPDRQPLWVDFADGSVPFWSTVFAKQGVIAAASNLIVPPQLRAGGAKTIYFDLNFHVRMGTPSNPADPAAIQGIADRQFDAAGTSSACATPVMALNELAGGQTPSPWTPTIERYRGNVLAYIQRLAERGARPALLVANRPFTGDPTADDWWRAVAQSSDIVLEVYFGGPSLSKQGPEKASLRLRSTLRARIADLTAIGVPSSRIGVMLTFSSTPGAGGRERLQPLSKWLDVVKWEALAAKQVAADTGIGSVWSWGWGTWNVAGNDPDKPIAACVWLWARDRSLCDAPAVADGRGFDPSLAVTRTLPAGALCVLDDATLWASSVAGLQRITGDRDIAYSAALQRLVLDEAAGASAHDVLAAERDVVADRFRGSRTLYLSALRKAGATPTSGRAVLADELRRKAVVSRLRVPAPSTRQIEAYYQTYADAPARFVRASRALDWLGNRKSGLALSTTAPGRVFRLRDGGHAMFGGVKVTAIGDAAPLGAFPLTAAVPSIRVALAAHAREDGFRTWSSQRQNQALNRLECAKDDLPQPAPVDLTDWLPFLSLD
jgi:hypothetical protein